MIWNFHLEWRLVILKLYIWFYCLRYWYLILENNSCYNAQLCLSFQKISTAQNDYGETKTPAATVLPNGGVDHDVMTEPPIVVTPTKARPCNRVPKMKVNGNLLGAKKKTSVWRNVQPLRSSSAGYGIPWSSFYGYNRSK